MSEMTATIKNAFIFLPDLLDQENIGFLEGFSVKCEENLVVFVLSEELGSDSSHSIGYVSAKTPENVDVYRKGSEWLHINCKSGAIKLNNATKCNLTCLRYNYNLFAKSEILTSNTDKYGFYFQTLINSIKMKQTEKHEIKNKSLNSAFLFFMVHLFGTFSILILQLLNKINPVIKYSAVLTQLEDSLTVTKWVYGKLQRDKKITLTIGNVLVSKALDLVFGLTVLFYFFKHEHEIITFVRDSTETIIVGIKQLLIVLMGSPVGLKLNYAFSQNLGKFFLYHITLWETFLLVTKFLMKYALRLLIIPGALGLTYQAALVSDLIAFATFHVYCIYVYAARLYDVQLQSILSLSKLFVGQKYNPLRSRMDSLQYTHNQLFIGTLGFTILLFLLPTTVLYYSVFSFLRLALILLDGVLLRLRYLLQCLPFYIVTLWMLRSPKIAGNIYLEIQKDCTPVTLHASLKITPLWSSILNCLPDVLPKFPSAAWGKIAHATFTGIIL